jgi:aminopeptidase N
MLRGLLGDARFFSALKTLYRTSRFRKIGTDDVRRVFEQESGRPLERFFERWIYEFDIPRAAWRVESGDDQTVVVVDQDGDHVFDFPLTVTFVDGQGKAQRVVVPVTAEQVRFTLPGRAPARDVRVEHGGSLVRLSHTR